MRKVIFHKTEVNNKYGRNKVAMIYIETDNGVFNLEKVYTDNDYYNYPDVIKIANALKNYGGYHNEIEQDYYTDEDEGTVVEYKVLFSYCKRLPIYFTEKCYDDEENYTIAVWKNNDIEVIYDNYIYW